MTHDTAILALLAELRARLAQVEHERDALAAEVDRLRRERDTP